VATRDIDAVSRGEGILKRDSVGVCVCASVCVCVCASVCVSAYIYICMHVCERVSVCVYMYKYTYTTLFFSSVMDREFLVAATFL
jgi:hypothetical protein